MNPISPVLARISDAVSLHAAGKSFEDGFRPRGVFYFSLKDSLGRIKKEWSSANLVTNAGFAGIASRINGSGGEAAATYLAVGTGTNAANATDTTLQTEITGSGLDRVNASASRVTTSVTNDTAQLTTTFTVTGSKAVTEAGVLNAASVGTLFARTVFAAVNVVSGDTLVVTYKIKAA